MNYPLSLKFKILAIAPQVYVKDANGNQIFYIKQKLFKLKEAIGIFSDDSQTQKLFEINADRIIDFSARYYFSDTSGNRFGSVKREGMKSIWKTTYKILEGEAEKFLIQEENPWVKVGDSILREIPLVGLASGYLLNPAYLVKRGEEVVMKLKKEPSFLESAFVIEKLREDLSEADERNILLSLMMVVLLERMKG